MVFEGGGEMRDWPPSWWGSAPLTKIGYPEKYSWEALPALTAVGGQVLPQIKGFEWENNSTQLLDN